MAKLMENSTKAKKFNNFNDKYKKITKAIRTLEEIKPDKQLSERPE